MAFLLLDRLTVSSSQSHLKLLQHSPISLLLFPGFIRKLLLTLNQVRSNQIHSHLNLIKMQLVSFFLWVKVLRSILIFKVELSQFFSSPWSLTLVWLIGSLFPGMLWSRLSQSVRCPRIPLPHAWRQVCCQACPGVEVRTG